MSDENPLPPVETTVHVTHLSPVGDRTGDKRGPARRRGKRRKNAPAQERDQETTLPEAGVVTDQDGHIDFRA